MTIYQDDRFAIENNNLTGKIRDCGQALAIADCENPSKIYCECCRCYGLFNAPTAYEKETLCSSSELVLIDNNYNSFDTTSEAGELIASERMLPGQTRICIAETDCYTFTSYFYVGPIIIDNKYITENLDSRTYNFGYSGNQTLERGACASYEICKMSLTAKSQQREMLNRLFKIYRTSDFIDKSSHHYKTLCWWLTEMKTEIISNHTQRYVLALLYESVAGERWIKNKNWLSKDKHECEWQGITCDQYLNVVNVDLSSNNLNGSIPTEIGEIKGLKKLDLASNNLLGSIPNKLSKLEKNGKA